MKNADQLLTVTKAVAQAIVARYPTLKELSRWVLADDAHNPTEVAVRVRFSGLETVDFRAPVGAWRAWTPHDVARLVQPEAKFGEGRSYHPHILSVVGDRFEYDDDTNRPPLSITLGWDLT